MAIMFNRQDTNIGGVFSAEKAKVTFTKAPGVSGTLVQGLNFTYAQNITRLYEVGTDKGAANTNIYYIGGRTQGTAAMQRVIGPDKTIQAMYSQFGDVCKAKSNELALNLAESDCSPGGASGSMVYTLKGCVITQVGVSINATDMIINEQLQLMFSGLSYD